MNQLLDPATVDAQFPRENRPFFRAVLLLVFLGPALGLLVQLPTAASFIHFAFEDMGSATKAAALIHQSKGLGSDFGYPYGLLTVGLVRIWNAVFGPSILSYLCLMIVLHLVMGWSFVRFVIFSRSRLLGVLVLLLQMIPTSEIWNAVYAVEAILLINVVAEVARSRIDLALGFATACIFAKPSMAYVAGFALVIIAIITPSPRGTWDRLNRLRIAAVVGATLALILLLGFGPRPLLFSISPGAGAALYREYHIGFFSGERSLWTPSGKTALFYFGTEVGFYLFGVLSLAFVAVALMVDSAASRAFDFPPIQQCILITAFCLVVYLLAFFNLWHYLYLVSVGLVACLSSTSPITVRWTRRIWTGAILLLAATANFTLGRGIIYEWKETQFPGPASVFGCAATGEQIREWRKCIDDSSIGSRVVLAGSAIDVIDPDLQAMPMVFPILGLVKKAEIDRGVSMVNAARFIIVPATLYPIEDWPEFSAVRDDFIVDFKGRYFKLLVRKSG